MVFEPPLGVADHRGWLATPRGWIGYPKQFRGGRPPSKQLGGGSTTTNLVGGGEAAILGEAESPPKIAATPH
jgi:hypothetical protein